MAQLTQTQVIAYNKKVQAAKEKASQDKARKELAEKELARTCKELSDMLGKEITPDNLEAEYAAFVTEAQKTMDSGNKILDGLEQEQEAALDRDVVISSTPAAPDVSPTTAQISVGGEDLDSLLGL